MKKILLLILLASAALVFILPKPHHSIEPFIFEMLESGNLDSFIHANQTHFDLNIEGKEILENSVFRIFGTNNTKDIKVLGNNSFFIPKFYRKYKEGEIVTFYNIAKNGSLRGIKFYVRQEKNKTNLIYKVEIFYYG